MKRFLGFVLVLLLLGIGVDFVLRNRAESAAAEMIDKRIAQRVDPEVELGGFPFLRSILTGSFDEITVFMPRAAEGVVMLEDVRLILEDVRLEPLEVLAGRGDLRAPTLAGEAIISEASLNRIVSSQIPGATVTIESNRVLVTRGGATAAANAVVAGNRLLFRAGELTPPLEVPLPALLPEVQFSSLRATPGELVLEIIGGPIRVRG